MINFARRVAAALTGRGRTAATSAEPFIELPDDSVGTASPEPIRLPAGRVFAEVSVGPRGDTLIGINRERCELIKVELHRNPRKKNDIVAEFAIMQTLSDRGCASCPTPLEVGEVQLPASIYASLSRPVDNTGPQRYVVQRYFPGGGRLRIADLMLSLLEQQALGIYQCDVKPAHLRLDRATGACVLIDYDQARALDASVRQLNCADFLSWTDEVERAKNGVEGWRGYFPTLRLEDLQRIMLNGALNLAETSLYKDQHSTNNALNAYHTIRERAVAVQGTRDLEDRRAILDTITFGHRERVLDVGCNAGLLCHYLHDRGCDVTGMDLDQPVVTAAGVLARITGRSIRFETGDLDSGALPGGRYDTVMLFSVLHHAQDVAAAAATIARSCDRIIIETRLIESGRKPTNGEWARTSGWQFDDVDQLLSHLSQLFPAFSNVRNHGIGGKGRFILELTRPGRS